MYLCVLCNNIAASISSFNNNNNHNMLSRSSIFYSLCRRQRHVEYERLSIKHRTYRVIYYHPRLTIAPTASRTVVQIYEYYIYIYVCIIHLYMNTGVYRTVKCCKVICAGRMSPKADENFEFHRRISTHIILLFFFNNMCIVHIIS